MLLQKHVNSGAHADAVEKKKALKQWINTELIIGKLGITDALDAELELIAANPEASIEAFAAVISLRAHIGWSTHGHSAVDVNIYSSGGPQAESIRGNVENTDVGKFLRNYLDVNVGPITDELRKKLKKDQSMAVLESPQDIEIQALPAAWVQG